MSIFPTKILLATDGSKDAKLAARTAADLAEKTGSELHIVYVGGEGFYETPLVDLATLVPTWVAREYPDLLSDIERTERELLDKEVEQVQAAGGKVTQAHLRMGEAAPDLRTVLYSPSCVEKMCSQKSASSVLYRTSVARPGRGCC
jgi:nucleotide-binding universal stress UspA family protein